VHSGRAGSSQDAWVASSPPAETCHDRHPGSTKPDSAAREDSRMATRGVAPGDAPLTPPGLELTHGGAHAELPRRSRAQPTAPAADRPYAFAVLVDGSADLRAWGIGASAVSVEDAFVVGRHLSAHDCWAGGLKELLLPELRALTPDKDDCSAVAEALALAVGCELAAELYTQHAPQGRIPIVTDHPETISIMIGLARKRTGRSHSPALLAAVSITAVSIWKLAARHGPVVIRDKLTVASAGGKEWTPHGLANRGRREGTLAVPTPAHDTPKMWERLLDIAAVQGDHGRVSHATITARPGQTVPGVSMEPSLRGR